MGGSEVGNRFLDQGVSVSEKRLPSKARDSRDMRTIDVGLRNASNAA